MSAAVSGGAPHHRALATRSSSSSSSRRRGSSCQAFKLTPATGTPGSIVDVSQPTFLVGSAAAADLQLARDNIAAEHAQLLQKGRQVFLKALQGNSVFDRTYSFIDGVEARPNVSYVLASGCVVAFGAQPEQCGYVVEFEEPSGANPMVEMLMQGMAASADASVKQTLRGD